MKMPYLSAKTFTAIICFEATQLQEDNFSKLQSLGKGEASKVSGCWEIFSITFNLFGLNFNQAEKYESNSRVNYILCFLYSHTTFF